MDFTEKERMNETMKKQNNLKRAIVVFLILVTCISMMSVTASAATSGSTNSRTIYVRTTANWSRPGSEDELVPLGHQNGQYVSELHH